MLDTGNYQILVLIHTTGKIGKTTENKVIWKFYHKGGILNNRTQFISFNPLKGSEYNYLPWE